ncbi:MAG: hypothetical protein GX879_06950, partial [Bacteroidales bacterium]|nr:hypothetical protein [Bacteroidales bacterium]
LMTQEAIRGNEWNATYRTTPPYHSCILPFTRFVAGPADYTTGIFKIIHSPEQNKRLYTTTSHQMALLTVFYSPMLMFADEIENYENSKAFHFIKDIPATWHKTKFLKSEPGKYVCVARNYENKWFVAAVTNEYSRLLKIPMDFLSDNINYIAEICCDTKHTNWETNPESIETYKIEIKNTDTIMAALAGTGGFNMKIYIDNDNPENSISIQEFNEHSLENYAIFAKAKVFGGKHTDNLSYNKPVKYNTNFNPLYPASGETALTDGIKTTYDYRKNWQGFYYDNLDVTIDLERETEVSSVEISFLESPHDWIFKPKKVSAYKSIDGENFTPIAEKILKDNAEINPHLANIYNINLDVENTEARYIKIVAENIKTCPNWHVGKGQKAWLFCDEIIVK